MTTAILGAAGATGKAIGEALSGAGMALRVIGRSEPRLRAAFGTLPNLTIVAADLATPAGAARACEGVDTAIMTLGLPYTQFADYPAVMRNIVEEACTAGVRTLLAR